MNSGILAALALLVITSYLLGVKKPTRFTPLEKATDFNRCRESHRF